MAYDHAEAISDFIQSHLADAVNTSLEGRIVAYNGGRVDVKPVGTKNYSDGDAVDFPVLYDLPLMWLAGDNGEAGVKIPVKIGDKCTIFFKQQPQADGDVENNRRFSMADAHVLPGVAYPDAHPGNNNVSLYYGDAFIEITPDRDININCRKFNVTASESETHTTPKATFSKELIAMGLLTFNSGMTGSGGTDVTATINGKVVITDGSSTIGGKEFLTHAHDKVEPGTGTSGGVA